MFWCGNDTARADRLFRQSKLYRPKWDEKHHADGRTYGQATLEKARSSSPYNPQHPHVAGAGPRTPLDERTGGGQVLGEPRYKVEHGQILAAKVEGRGEAQAVTYYPLSNFAAAIRREVVATDGLESEVLFELEGYTATGRALPVAQVRAAEFASMNWVTKHWGSEAVVQPGQGAKDHLRAAIQYLSLGLTTRATVHKHLGWAKVGGHHVYLHAGGGIGPDGAVPGLEVDPGRALSGFILPEPPTGEAEREAILQLWELRHLAPARVTVPLILYSLAAPLGHTPFSLYLSGPTGARKTSLALVLQSLWGGHDAPPTGWEATANALEGSAFTAKDSLLLIDDYAPQNAEGRQKELQAKAARLLRNQGNGVGRLRMRADGSLAPDKPPRGSLLITGEDLPPGHSVRARCLFLELERGDVDLERLSRAQALARDGVYAQALGAWVRYLARALEDHQARLTRRVAELRPRWSAEHGRTTDALARLHATWETYRVYAATVGVELQALEAGVLEALEQVRTAQAQHHKDADPAERFGALLFAALRMGRAHLVPTDWRAGQSVEDYLTHPASWGWQYHEPTSSSDFAAGVWRPQGPAIGWIPSDPETHGIYLDPKAAYAVLARLAGETGEPLPTERTLWKRLGEAGAIRTQADGESVRYQARVRIGGELHRVVHVLGPYIGKTGNTGNNTTNTVQDDTKPVPGFSSVPGSDREQNPDPDTPPVVFPEATGNNPETGNSLNSVQDDKNSPVPGVPGFADRRPLGFAQPPEDEDGEWEVVEL
ncbi:DUF927 domain-containing protein [Meiothermus sp. PNK-Is4]|nr:DNA primase [Meiothermus sp. Pnk-1]RYM35405.1 DUF927 domain-containing protein [Meiothermus sp. PNK-Is4]